MKEQDRHNEDPIQPRQTGIPGLEKGGPTPFKVPEGYFDELTPRVMSKIHEAETSTKEESAGFPVWRLAGLGLATLVIGLLIFNPFSKPADLSSQFAEVAESHSLEFLVAEADISIDDLLAADLIELEEESDSDEDAYLEYLIENEVELSTIVDELTL